MIKNPFLNNNPSAAASSAADGSSKAGANPFNKGKSRRPKDGEAPTCDGVIITVGGVELKQIIEGYFKDKYGSLDLSVGTRNQAIYKLGSELGAWLGHSDAVAESAVYACRNICTSLPDEEFIATLSNGVRGKQSIVSNDLRNYLYNIGLSLDGRKIERKDSGASTQANDAKTAAKTAVKADAKADGGEEEGTLTLDGDEFPMLNLPRALKIILNLVPEHLRAALFCLFMAVCAQLGASKALVKSADGIFSRILILVVLIGEQSCGKSRLFKILFDAFLNDIFIKDDQERAAYQQWVNKKVIANGNTQLTAPPEPKPHIVGSSCSTLQLLQYLYACEPDSMLLQTDEVSELSAAKGSAFDWSVVIRKAFDDQRHSHDTLSIISKNISCRLRLNMIIAGQPQAAVSWIGEQGVYNGAASRILWATASSNLYGDGVVFKSLTDAERNILKSEIVDVLAAVQQDEVIELPQCAKIISSWRRDILQSVKDEVACGGAEDKAKLQFSIRVGEIALRCGAIMYILSGRKETAGVKGIVQWILNYALKNVHSLFAHEVNRKDAVLERIAANKNAYNSSSELLLSELPPEFTKAELKALLLSKGRSGNETTVRGVLAKLKIDCGLERVDKGRYKKKVD